MSVSVNDRELQAMVRRLERAGRATPRNIRTILSKIGSIVQGTAVKYAPRSMTKSEYVRTLVHGKTKRRVFTSGQLKGSITADVRTDRVDIGVPSNSRAADYAEKVHKEWKPTSHNPSVARREFIYEAEKDKKREYMREVDRFVDKIIRDI